MTDRLFVYGTLGPGRPNAHVLSAVDGEWEEGQVVGVLREHGWGAALGYPAIELVAGTDRVDGFVLTSNLLNQHWSRLDEFEGEGYERVTTRAHLMSGPEVDVQIYVARGLA